LSTPRRRGRIAAPERGGAWNMKIDVLTLFPEMFAGPLDVSIVKRARETGLLDLRVHNLRDWTHDRYKCGRPSIWRRARHGVEARTDL
jgi:hypothetical protein